MGILSNGYYIDLIQPASYHYLNDPIDKDSPLTSEERKRILGGEATSWGELVIPETIDSRIWPRTAAIAERLWSPQDVDDVDDMYTRLERISFLLEEHGLQHIKNYDMMLRRLTNNNDISALKTLVDVVEPVKIYTRHHQGVKYQQHSPYTRAVDAARPESMTARDFSILVDNYIRNKDKVSLQKIRQMLEKWQANHEKFAETMNISPIVRELEPLSMNLKNLSQVGLESLQLIKQGNRAPVTWLDKAGAIIEEAKKPYGQVELRIVDPIEKLVEFSK
jgi:hexosaminidase